jgi:hypothetical protein
MLRGEASPVVLVKREDTTWTDPGGIRQSTSEIYLKTTTGFAISKRPELNREK